MRLRKMTEKQFLKPSYNSEKSVAICEFVNIQSQFCGIDSANTILLKCRQLAFASRIAFQKLS